LALARTGLTIARTGLTIAIKAVRMRMSTRLAAIAAALLLCAPASALASTPITQYTIPRSIVVNGVTNTVGSPSGITTGPDGNVWFTCEKGGVIGRITPLGQITLFPVTAANHSLGGINTGPDGRLWFNDFTGQSTDRIVTDGSGLTLFPLGAGAGGLVSNMGAVVIAESLVSKIGVMSATGQVIAYPTPTANAFPHGINIGPNGDTWFVEMYADRIADMNPATNQIVEHPVPTAGSDPRVIVPDLALGTLFFSEFKGNKIGESTITGQMTEFRVPTFNSGPDGIAVMPSGNVTFTEYTANKLAVLNLTTGQVTEQTTGAGSAPDKVTIGSDGRTYFTEHGANAIGAW
jgi:streptogramin lyase